jgi:hypothetical protein
MPPLAGHRFVDPNRHATPTVDEAAGEPFGHDLASVRINKTPLNVADNPPTSWAGSPEIA